MKINGKKKLLGLEVWNNEIKRLENTSYRTYF